MKQPSGGCGDAPNLRVFPNGQEGYLYEILSQEGKSDCSYAPNSSLEYSAFLEKVEQVPSGTSALMLVMKKGRDGEEWPLISVPEQ